MHADWTLLPRGHFSTRANVQLLAKIELASSLIKNVHDDLAFMFVHLAVLVLALLVAIPNALAPVALLEGVARPQEVQRVLLAYLVDVAEL